LNKVAESTRDFRRYLSTDPIPADFKEVQGELDDLIESKIKAEQGRQPHSRPGSATANGNNNRNAKENVRFANGYTPFSNATFAEEFANRPNSARNNSGDQNKVCFLSYVIWNTWLQ
jgi:hypothetical protein